MPSYKHLIFDADHTLINYDADERGAFLRLFSDFGVALDEKQLARCQFLSVQAWSEAGLFDVHTEKTQREYHLLYRSHLLHLFSWLFDEMSINADVGGTSERFLKELEHISEPIQGAKELLLSLQGRCRLHVATNGLSSIQRGRLACFSGLFDEFFISEEMNVIKPKAEFFEQIFERLHAKKQDCLMIGDSLLSDVAGANGVGIDSCWFNPQKKPNETEIRPTFEIASFEELGKILK